MSFPWLYLFSLKNVLAFLCIFFQLGYYVHLLFRCSQLSAEYVREDVTSTSMMMMMMMMMMTT